MTTFVTYTHIEGQLIHILVSDTQHLNQVDARLRTLNTRPKKAVATVNGSQRPARIISQAAYDKVVAAATAKGNDIFLSFPLTNITDLNVA